MDKDGEDVLYAEDNEEGFKFKKGLGKDFDYLAFADLKLFLDLINHFDDKLFDNFEVLELVTTL
jgi:hypothetical protein